MRAGIRNLLINTFLAIGSLLFALLGVEVLIGFVLSHPNILPNRAGGLRDNLRQYYMNFDRAIVQYVPECFRYDPELTYTLRRDSSCTVVTREHTVEYQSNREGIRDSDQALEHPQIVVVGDSHAMGWGVTPEESFPKLLEKNLHLSVLNTAISSYGTARELALLERLRVPDFPILIIQYCDNDFGENKFLAEKGELYIRSEQEFTAVAEKEIKRTHYYPLKHTAELLKIAATNWRRPPQSLPDTDNEEAKFFMEVLLRHQKLLQSKTVIVIELNGNNYNDAHFIKAVGELLNEPKFQTLRSSLVPLDVSQTLTYKDYYVLDDHMKPVGHRKVARLIEAELARRGVLPRS